MVKYLGKAHPGDRFIGINCGCVVVVRNHEIAGQIFNPVYRPKSEWAFQCKAQDPKFAVDPYDDAVTANVYFECQAILMPNASGLRWQ